jgi:hypothetical protein
MSADNWTICPQCKKNAENNITKLQEKLKSSYGKISQTEYSNLLDSLKIEWETIDELEHTLREDWDLNMNDDGEVYIKYSCSCTECGFNYEFLHTENVELK